MSKEIGKEIEIEEIIKPTPKQTEFTVQLPDREKQWEKCPVVVAKTKTVQLITREVIDGKLVEHTGIAEEVSYTEYAVEDSAVVHGGVSKTPIKLSDVTKKVNDGVAIIAVKPQENLTAAEKTKVDLGMVLAENFSDDKGIIDEKQLKEKAVWGLGCPANCGGFREFTFAEMVPQNYKCDVCGVTVILV